MKILLNITLAIISLITMNHSDEQSSSKVDYPEFEKLTKDVGAYRAERLIDSKTFASYAEDPNTIVLDTRSKMAYDDIHIKGAVHLNFSDFTLASLEKVIPNKKTRVLIYCNNNFFSNRMALYDKMAPLALNIPTFINLYGYGYQNVYELNEYLPEINEDLQVVTRDQIKN